MVFLNGPMVLNTKAFGCTIRPVGMEGLDIRVEMCMMDSGIMTRPMAMES
jgi:hypothetical protein